MITVRKDNVELTVEETALGALQLQGFEEIDAKTGKVKNPKKTELQKLTDENKALKKENKALKEDLDKANAEIEELKKAPSAESKQ